MRREVMNVQTFRVKIAPPSISFVNDIATFLLLVLFCHIFFIVLLLLACMRKYGKGSFLQTNRSFYSGRVIKLTDK